MAPIQRTLRRAFDSFKDRTSISLARFANFTVPDLEVALLKATSHDELPPSEKYVQDILRFSNSHVCIIAVLTRRLKKTRNWIVALKVLMLVHRLLRDGNPEFEQEMKMSGRRLLSVCNFKDESRGDAWDYSAFVRIYGLYLNELLDCSVGSLRSRAAQSGFDNGSGGYYRHDYEDWSRQEEDFEQTRRSKPVREMHAEELLETFPVFQRILERVLACRPSGRATDNRLIQIALHPVVKESFQIYSDIRDGLAILLDAFFDMEQGHCVTVFDIYIRSGQQIDELIGFHSFCKTIGVCKVTEYPVVEKITEDLLETLEEFLNHQFESVREMPKSPQPYMSPRPSFEESSEEGGYEINGMKALPAPPPVKDVEFSEHDSNAKPVLNADDNVKLLDLSPYDKNVNLLDLSEDSEGEKLALALFSSKEDQGTARKLCATAGPAAGWELALVDSKSDDSKPSGHTAMAAGFDSFILDNLYDQGALEQREKLFAAGTMITSSGSASSMQASMIPPQVSQSYLALSAPTAASQQVPMVQVHDPFAASVNIPPPAYVQMADFKRKQQLLVREQQLWLQYQQNGIHAYNAVFKFANSNAYATAFQPPYAAPYHSVNSFYR